MFRLRFSIAVALAGLVASCADEKAAGEQAATPAPKEKGFDRYMTSNPMYDSKEKSKSASENSKANSMFNSEYSKKEFATKDYSKKSFWGTREYAKKVYGGDTDGSRFMRSAREGGAGARKGAMTSREAGRSFATATRKTGSAREAGAAEIARTSDAETDIRRGIWKQPEIRDSRTRRVISMDETKSMLGR